GDAAEARKAVIAEEADMKFIDEMAGATASFKKLAEAAKAKYGDAGQEIVPFNSDETRLDILDSATESVTGDTASVTSPQSQDKIELKKVGSDWKIDLSKMPNLAQMKQALPMFRTMKKFADDFTADINAGKYATTADAKSAMETKMKDMIMEQA